MKTVLFVFNGDPMCFIHVLLNALDMQARGDECRVVVEGSATRLIPELAGADRRPGGRSVQGLLPEDGNPGRRPGAGADVAG